MSGFEFPDDERTSRRSSSATSCSRSTSRESADDPDNPTSHLGNTAKNFYVETFADSYGDPQPVQVVAKKSLGDVRLRYRINDGAVKTRQHGAVRRW